jgi:hypothetical protein
MFATMEQQKADQVTMSAATSNRQCAPSWAFVQTVSAT